MAIAMATKIQLLLYIPLIIIVYLVVFPKNNINHFIKKLLLIGFFYILLLAGNFFIHGYEATAELINIYFIGRNTAGAFSLNFSKIINKTLLLNEILFLPLFIFIWVKSWTLIKEKYNNLYMKFIFVGAIVIVTHWLFFFGASTWRNVFIGLSFNAVLFALYLKEKPKLAKLILIPYILFGLITNYGFIKNGVTDDVQYYRAHVLDNVISTTTNNDQRIFFDKMNKIIQERDVVFSPVQPFIPRLFLPNNEVKLLKEYEKNEDNNFLVIYPGAVKEKYIESRGYSPLVNNSRQLLKVGEYSLYKLP